MTWEEKVASLEREVAELQSTVTKYDEWFQDQKMFCDCVGKFFKRQFGKSSLSNFEINTLECIMYLKTRQCVCIHRF